ncbi:hypothetical protein [Flavobacterium selenitireducens]|uniref:hypothetical protein n=1 Tax=Flavobacterium selenitireducens TaxID=2722704 RepID=UPI00168BC34F|nr:hypothetical protein [Flavobacterium selenitireducens]MBD3581339.1 hypothetical protein [Flavobacterium selenitireducens]
MLISIETDNETLLDIAQTPFVGTFVIVLLVFAPFLALLIVNALLGFGLEKHLGNASMAISGIWTAYLMYKRRTTICFVFIPVWIMLLLFGLENIVVSYWF